MGRWSSRQGQPVRGPSCHAVGRCASLRARPASPSVDFVSGRPRSRISCAARPGRRASGPRSITGAGSWSACPSRGDPAGSPRNRRSRPSSSSVPPGCFGTWRDTSGSVPRLERAPGSASSCIAASPIESAWLPGRAVRASSESAAMRVTSSSSGPDPASAGMRVDSSSGGCGTAHRSPSSPRSRVTRRLSGCGPLESTCEIRGAAGAAPPAGGA